MPAEQREADFASILGRAKTLVRQEVEQTPVAKPDPRLIPLVNQKVPEFSVAIFHMERQTLQHFADMIRAYARNDGRTRDPRVVYEDPILMMIPRLTSVLSWQQQVEHMGLQSASGYQRNFNAKLPLFWAIARSRTREVADFPDDGTFEAYPEAICVITTIEQQDEVKGEMLRVRAVRAVLC
jgi:hypothetical protein